MTRRQWIERGCHVRHQRTSAVVDPMSGSRHEADIAVRPLQSRATGHYPIPKKRVKASSSSRVVSTPRAINLRLKDWSILLSRKSRSNDPIGVIWVAHVAGEILNLHHTAPEALVNSAQS